MEKDPEFERFYSYSLCTYISNISRGRNGAFEAGSYRMMQYVRVRTCNEARISCLIMRKLGIRRWMMAIENLNKQELFVVLNLCFDLFVRDRSRGLL